MYLLEQLHDGVLIEFTRNELIFNIGLVCLLLVAVSIDLVIVYSFMKQKAIPMDSQFILSLTVADLMFGVLEVVLKLINSANNGVAIGHAGCFWDTVLVIWTLGCSVLSVFGLSLHRYISVMHRYQLSQKQVYWLMGVLWIGLAFLVSVFTFPFRPDTLIGLQSSKQYCMIASPSSAPRNVIATFVDVVLVFGSVLFQGFVYYRITASYLSTKARGTTKLDKRDKERKLIEKSIAITSIFFVSWIFMIIKMVYECATKQEAPGYYDTLCSYLGCLSPIANGFIIYHYDGHSRSNIRELFMQRGRDACTQSVVAVSSAVNVLKTLPTNSPQHIPLDTIIIAR